MRVSQVGFVAMLALLAATAADAGTCVPVLPEAHTNNAVAATMVGGTNTLFSVVGLRGGKTWRDTSRKAYMYKAGDVTWTRLPDLPVPGGRLAATAEALSGKLYIFGGYSVAEDGGEVSEPENFAFDPETLSYIRIADMPTPVDDAVSFVYGARYIYIVSGWHNEGNVRDVQVYDTAEDRWFKAADYPGSPVFGHAGGIVGNRFVIADGVAVVGHDATGKRQFDTVNEGWMGIIDEDDPSTITYRRLPQLPGRGHYRMGGEGDVQGNRVLFVGGTPNAYNYNGIGYNGEPSKPQKHVFAWDFERDNWVAYADKPIATMDHRGLMQWNGDWITVGGLTEGQKVTDGVASVYGKVTTCR
ncbi:Kelch repeat-containing protein [Kordiimonas sp.]|uniref:Kelch repeat-containing protein n=1 Tax=Kordiimonas sp. TaxID=1970157 RepID=UPI003A94D029